MLAFYSIYDLLFVESDTSKIMLTNWDGQKETSPVSVFKDSLEVFWKFLVLKLVDSVKVIN